MGGLAAVIAADGVAEQGAVSRMLAPVAHRGSERRITVHGRTLLGVVHGPGAEDASLEVGDGIAVAFTGVLDNAAELSASLGRNGEEPGSPSRLLGRAFRHFGADLPSRLRGMYSVVISDGQRLFSFRDHLGLETLFFRRDGAGCWLASEAKQVVAGAEIPREPDLDVVERIFFDDVDESLPPALQGVERLRKRTILESDGRTLRTRPYWDPASLLETARFTAEEIQVRFDALMTQAARRVVTGTDVVALSGGIDSPAVAAFAAPVHLERSGTPLQALTMVYPDHPSVDEREYTELVAEALGIPLHPYRPQARPFDRIQEWMNLADGPTGFPALAGYAELYGEARALGARTVLLGEMAECVSAAPRGHLVHLLAHARFGPLRNQFQARRAHGVSLVAFTRPILTPFAPTRLRALRWGRPYLNVPVWVDVQRVKEVAVKRTAPVAQRWSRNQLAFFTGANLAFDAESICQQVCGVRGRRPWADVDLWEFFLSLPAEVKFPPAATTKGLVRHLLRGRVPDTILDRRDKTVFVEPELANVDEAALERWFVDPPWRIGGVDYQLLADRLSARPPAWIDWHWARNLASVHAFLSTW